MRTALIAAAPLFAALSAMAQSDADDVFVFGLVKDWQTGAPITDARVVVIDEVGQERTLAVSDSGTYGIDMDYDRRWTFRFEAPGRVGKRVEVDARGVPADDRAGGHGMNIVMTLFPREPGKDYSLFDTPISTAAYVDSLASFAWDMAKADSMRALMEPLLPDTTRQEEPVVDAGAEPRFGTTEIMIIVVILLVLVMVPAAVAIWWFLLRKRP